MFTKYNKHLSNFSDFKNIKNVEPEKQKILKKLVGTYKCFFFEKNIFIEGSVIARCKRYHSEIALVGNFHYYCYYQHLWIMITVIVYVLKFFDKVL